MAAAAWLWPFDFSWLRIDSIWKFVEPVTNTHEESLSVGLAVGLRFASRFLPIVFQTREIFCPAPDKTSFFAAITGLWSVPFITSFSFRAGGIYRLRTWARGHKKPSSDIHWRSSKRKQYGGHFHWSLNCMMGRLGSSHFSWMWLGHEAVHFHSRKRLPVVRFFLFFFLSFCMLNIVSQFSKH